MAGEAEGNRAAYMHDYHSAADALQHLHDLRLVWAFEVSPGATF